MDTCQSTPQPKRQRHSRKFRSNKPRPEAGEEAMQAWSEGVEFRSYADDSWYSVRVMVEEEVGRLRVRYCHFPEDNDSVFDANGFDTWEKLDDFRDRFRRVSVQLQDTYCRRVGEGTEVCAAHGFTKDDVRFYDAFVEQVKWEEHSLVKGEEECSCSFMVVWKHGPTAGLLTEKKIESICIVQPNASLDPNVASFINIAKHRIQAVAPRQSSDANLTNCSHVVSPKDESFISPQQEVGRINNLLRQQDVDIGGVGNYHTILIENLETELSSSTIIEFIHQQTSITVQAYVFPSLPSDCYTRGVIVVHFDKDLEDLSDFLNCPDHFIVSSRGRPWVVAKTFSKSDIFRASIGTPMFASQRKSQKGNLRINNELKVVRSGTEEYKTAKELRDLLVEFTTHREGLHKSLAFEERKILRRSAADHNYTDQI